VCQDFSHIMLATLRRLGLACRYVSGYIAPHEFDVAGSRSAPIASHAWVEVRLPELGWVGVDPTNNIEAGRRHVRVGIGRDYADVPPTRGVFKGTSAVRSELAVGVSIGTTRQYTDPGAFTPWMSREAAAPIVDVDSHQQQQQ